MGMGGGPGAVWGGGMLEEYLRATAIIDWQEPAVGRLARALGGGATEAVVRRCFEWVRDEIRHSVDYGANPVTCRASEVLAAGTGFCYTKSHLLAALLRANGVPTGFCYQRLCQDEAGQDFCLHGLNAVYLPEYGWYRLDARGNKPGVDAQFVPPREQLAFATAMPGEMLFPEIWADPLPIVVAALQGHETWEALAANLPDLQPTALR